MTGMVGRGRWSRVRGVVRPVALAAVLGLVIGAGPGMPAQAQEEGESLQIVAPDTAGFFELPDEGGPDRVEIVGWVCSPRLAAAVTGGRLQSLLRRLWNPRWRACTGNILNRECVTVTNDGDHSMAQRIVNSEAACNGSIPGPLRPLASDCTTQFPGQRGLELLPPGESLHLFVENCFRVPELAELAEHVRAAAWAFVDAKSRRQ